MSKGKVGILTQVMEKIEQNGTIDCMYINDKGCMCAVGYIMSEVGVDMSIFENHGLNTDFIGTVMMNRDIYEPLADFGFTVEELDKLQSINDLYLNKYQRSTAVVTHIREMIKEQK